MDWSSYLWILVSTLMFLHQCHASSIPGMSPTAEERPPVQLHHRERRCSCENQKDKECIFYCHIGIVWVNTPSQVVPYGFGSIRLRRELRRCLCIHSHDTECLRFCSVHTQIQEKGAAEKTKTNGEWLKRHPEGFWEKRSRHAFKHQT
ncbi:endothelin-3 [Gouania willdenowi]|uniref:Endothelin-3-like n=1 Tax=Gouania willdenowi TaxID=441366 RepID=A0A8C5DU89_GOUWI|nr:endothelin-3-like [Gouania willdenowi]